LSDILEENPDEKFFLSQEQTERVLSHQYDGARIRRLTPLECERLQGFPDGWTEGISDTQRYKTLGNAVTVNVVEAVITSLMRTYE
jgi:site-specific DNA-cytosine methylase